MKLCIFDFDGTLFDSITDVVNCFNRTFEKLGYETLDFEFYKKSLGGNINEIIPLILKDKNTAENVEMVKKTYAQIYCKDKKENTKLFEGIHELLKQLQEEGYILAINSNRKNNSIIHFIDKYADDINFIDIQGHDENYPSKPDAYGVNTIMTKANARKDETIYIGDSITDIRTAKNADIDCILVKWGYGIGNVYEDQYPVKIVENTGELYQSITEYFE